MLSMLSDLEILRITLYFPVSSLIPEELSKLQALVKPLHHLTVKVSSWVTGLGFL